MKQKVRKEIETMKMLNEKELMLANGGAMTGTPVRRNSEAEREARQREQFEQEKRRLEGLADIRLRAGENAMKAAMRMQRAEMEIKAAQLARMAAV